MKLLLDEMWSPDIAVQLRLRGYDVVAVAERRDLRRQPDDVVLEIAQMEGRCLVTEDAGDYRALATARLQEGLSHLGLILTTNRRFPRHDLRTPGRMVRALTELLDGDPDLTNREHWLP